MDCSLQIRVNKIKLKLRKTISDAVELDRGIVVNVVVEEARAQAEGGNDLVATDDLVLTCY